MYNLIRQWFLKKIQTSREFTIKIKNETNKYTSYLKIEMKMENIKIYIWQ